MLDAQPDLQADIPGIDVEAVVSRQWDDGVALARADESRRDPRFDRRDRSRHERPGEPRRSSSR